MTSASEISTVFGAKKCVHISVKPNPEVGETALLSIAETLARRSKVELRDCSSATIDLEHACIDE